MQAADGAVHFISNEIDPVVYKGFGSRNGGEEGSMP